MPIIKPEIQNILREVGLAPEERTPSGGPLVDKLDSAGITDEFILERMYELLNSGNEAIRKNIIDSILKMKGALKEGSVASAPSFTLIIQPSNFGGSEKAEGLNPILFPRSPSKDKIQ